MGLVGWLFSLYGVLFCLCLLLLALVNSVVLICYWAVLFGCLGGRFVVMIWWLLIDGCGELGLAVCG